MYYFYFNKVCFPVAPESMDTSIKGTNSTITLINEGEINQIKSPGLTEFSFDLLLPQINKYPFATYKNSLNIKLPFMKKPLSIPTNLMMPAEYYLNYIESFMKSKESFQFKVIRRSPTGKVLFDTTMSVTLEEYTIKEDANNGFDVVVSVKLKKYVKYGTVKVKVKKKGSKKVLQKKTIRKINKSLPATYKIKKGDTLYLIAKKYYTSGDKSYREAIYKKNKKVIEDEAKRAGHKTSVKGKFLVKGTKITIPKIKE